MMSKGKDLMIITYSAMSKSRAIMALDLNLEKRLLEGVSYFSFATLEKRKKLGRLTFTKTSGTVLLGTGKIIGKLLTGASQVSIPETIAGYAGSCWIRILALFHVCPVPRCLSLSLDENLRVKEFRRREVENGRDGLSPLFSLLSVIHCASAPVTSVSLEFRALPCVKNEVTTSIFNGLFETSSSTRATVSKQTVQNVLMATAEFYWVKV